jgi:hypothetical protein
VKSKQSVIPSDAASRAFSVFNPNVSSQNSERESCSVTIGIANESTPAIVVAALGRTEDLRGAGASGLDLDCVALVQLCFSALLKHHQHGPGS